MKPNGSASRGRRAVLLAGLAAIFALGAIGVTSGSAAPTGADLSLAKTASASSVKVGSNVTYTMVVTNLGPEGASEVTLTDPLPNGVKFVSATSTLGQCSVQGQQLTCGFGALEAGAAPAVSSASVTLVATMEKTGTITNTASVAGNQTDAVPANNAASATVTVLAKSNYKPAHHHHHPVHHRNATCRGVKATIIGTSGSDHLVGTKGRDVIVALGGNDVIKSLSGRDLVCAGRGNDVVKSGSGADRVFGGAGRDRLLGRGGPDLLNGSTGRDRLKGGPGSDRLRGGRGIDACSGGSGSDSLESCEL